MTWKSVSSFNRHQETASGFFPAGSGIQKAKKKILDPSKVFSFAVTNPNLKIEIHKTIIFPVVLYGCETWSLTLREECSLRVFENRILRRIFGPKRKVGVLSKF